MNAPDRSRPLAEMHRRSFLKTVGVVGTTAGLEGILAARRAPAFGQTTKIHLLQWVDFIPEGDVEVKRQVAEYGKADEGRGRLRDDQRQRPPGPHHRGDPVRNPAPTSS